MTTEAEVVAGLAKASQHSPTSIVVDTDDGRRREFIAVPVGMDLNEVQDIYAQPRHVEESHTFSEVDSLSAFANAYGRPDVTVAFSSWRDAQISLKIDYHERSDAGIRPSRCTFTPRFQAQKSSMWQKWIDAQKAMSQVGFARFLEERAHEITSPDAATVMEAAINFESLRNTKFSASVRLKDGEREFHFSDKDSVKSSAAMPEMLTLLVPVFEGEEPEVIRCRVRHRVNDGELIFFLAFDNIDEIHKQAFERCVDRFETGLDKKLPIYRIV